LTTLAIERPSEGHDGERGIAVIKYLDLALLLIALPVFIATGLPVLGWAGAAVGWTGQRLIQHLIEAKAVKTEDTRGFFQLMAGSIIGRSWFLVISIITVGLIEQQAGLTAAVLSAIVFTCYLVTTLLTRTSTGGVTRLPESRPTAEAGPTTAKVRGARPGDAARPGEPAGADPQDGGRP
jgi:hypothetical protein